MRRITLDRRKWGDRPHYRYGLRFLGDDDWGRWLYLPAGEPIMRGDVEQGRAEHASVYLLPWQGWWWAAWHRDRDAWIELYVDVSMPCRWDGDVATSVDLDLDLIRDWDGVVKLLDEDEFAIHRAEYGYPDDLVARVESVAATLALALRRRDEPFGSAAAPWLEKIGS